MQALYQALLEARKPLDVQWKEAAMMLVLLLAALLLVPWPGEAASLVAGPWLQAATETSIVIMWESSDTTAGLVEVGTTTGAGRTVRATVAVVPPATGGDTRADPAYGARDWPAPRYPVPVPRARAAVPPVRFARTKPAGRTASCMCRIRTRSA